MILDKAAYAEALKSMSDLDLIREYSRCTVTKLPSLEQIPWLFNSKSEVGFNMCAADVVAFVDQIGCIMREMKERF